MAFTLPPLPYATDALAPTISQQTLELHHGTHHQTYVDKANDLSGGERTNADLERVILEADGPLFNNAAQHWNHAFYWESMTPNGGGRPGGELAEALSSAFGSIDAFLEEYSTAAIEHFGSGYAWLVHDGSKLAVTHTSDADLPLQHSQHALLTIDVWEHAYYLDHQNRRPEYVSAFLARVVAWDVVAKRLAEV
ncbi:MAG: superoxide dismutase [Acidimicrobiales bacterium]|nr:superoxide dismutase [Acidimicrobiales bacterium]